MGGQSGGSSSAGTATREAEKPEAGRALEENVGVREQGGEIRCPEGKERREETGKSPMRSHRAALPPNLRL